MVQSQLYLLTNTTLQIPVKFNDRFSDENLTLLTAHERHEVPVNPLPDAQSVCLANGVEASTELCGNVDLLLVDQSRMMVVLEHV